MFRPTFSTPVCPAPPFCRFERLRAVLRAKTAWTGLLAVLFFWAFPATAFARPLHLNDPDYLVEVWETEDALPDDTVPALAQTPDGYLWMGTPTGLVRFDGFQFTRFTHDTAPELPQDWILALWADSGGRLWVSTSAGLCYRQGSRFSPIPGEASAITSISEEDGVLWFAGTNGTIARFQGEQAVSVPTSRATGFVALLADIDSTAGLWAVYRDGLGRLSKEGWKRIAGLPGGGGGEILGACPSRSGGLWIATRTTLQLIRSGAITRQVLRKPATDEPLVMLEDSHGHLWTAGAAAGLVRHSASGVDRTISRAERPFQSRVLAMLEDREGGIWFGSEGGGIVRLKPRRFSPLSDDFSLVLASLAESSSGSRLSNDPRNGLALKLADRPQIPAELLDAVPGATSALVASDGRLLVGSPVGLFHLGSGAAPMPVALPVSGPVAIHHLANGPTGETLVATSRGLFALRGAEADPLGLPPGATGVSRLLVAGDTAYAATLPAGLCVLRNGRMEPVAEASGTTPGPITALAAGPDERIWFSGPECRLASLRDGVLEPVSDTRLPAVPFFTALAADGAGTLWLGSADGLFRLSAADLAKPIPATGDTPLWTRFDTKDGLAGQKIQSLVLSLGPTGHSPRLLVGTSRGFSTAEPATFRAKSQPCRPVIESLVCYERIDASDSNHQIEPELGSVILKAVNEHATVLPLGPAVPVPARAHRVEVRFTAVAFDAPERLRFRYRLLGLQDEWTELAGNCPIPFHALPPGRFTFQVMAANTAGVWGEEIASVGFVVKPAFWQTFWFRSFLGLGALLGLAGLVRNSARTRNRRHELLLEQQRHLAREKARLASVLETTSDVVAFTDPDLRIFYLNPAGCRTLEIMAPSPDRTLPFDSILAAESITRFHEEAAPAAILRGVWSGEMALQTDNVRPLIVSQVMLCHKHTDGSVDFFSFVMRDLSPIKEAEARHEKLEAQLRQAQKMEAVGLLAGGVAHDFNNILQVILGHSSIALEKGVPPEDRENSLIEVKKAARRAAQLTKQLLAFGRRQPLQKLHFDLNTVVRDALDMSRRLLGADIEIEFHPSDEPAVVFADRGQIEQVVMNLSVNARDAMPRGGRLTIDITPIGTSLAEGDTSVIGPLPSGPCVRITVSDTGVGISPENLPHIFEPFFTTKSKNKGSGLGLSVVYGIIQQHGGNLRLESKVGVGTTFRIYLPASPGAVAVQRVTREIPVKRGSGTILVAEDEEAVRLLATRTLQKAGYTVLSARDGEEAVALFREHSDNVDLLLMDVIMPRLSGPEAVKQIRELDPEVPALYASGYGGEFLRADGRLDIEGEVLQKPYQPSELLDRISGYLRSAR